MEPPILALLSRHTSHSIKPAIIQKAGQQWRFAMEKRNAV